MEKKELKFESYLSDISPEHEGLVLGLHDMMTGRGCQVKLQEAKMGHVVSFTDPKTKKTVANFVSRKKGPMVRIYGDNSDKYPELIGELPAGMVADVEKSSVCRRLLDPTKCNSRCQMGYVLTLGGTEHKKCRNSCFMFFINKENTPWVQKLLDRELSERAL